MTGAAPLASGPAAPDLRLALPGAAAWPTAWWATGAGAAHATVAAALAAVTLAALCLYLYRTPDAGSLGRSRSRSSRFLASVALVVAACAAVCSSAAVLTTVRTAGPLPALTAARAVVELSGSAAGDAVRLAPGRFGGPQRFGVRLDVRQVSGRGSTSTVGSPVFVIADPRWSSVTAGQEVTFTGRLAPPGPGDGTVALVGALGPPQIREGAWFWRVADHVRAGLRAACAGLDEDAGGLLPSLVVGDTSTLPEALRTDLRVSGLTHLTAVSGANVAIVVGSTMWVAAALGAPRAARWGGAAVALLGFVALARPQPSVLRAGAMAALALTALAGARRPRGVPVLSAAVIALLVGDPWLARSAGFALSAVATGSLLLLAPAWVARLERYVPRPVAVALAAPAAAQAACGPVVVLLDPAVSMVAVPANLLAQPAVAPATVLGVVAALVSTVWPTGARAVAATAAVATGWISEVAHRAAAVPGAQMPWPGGVAGAILLLALTAAVVAASLGWRGPVPRRASRRVRVGTVGAGGATGAWRPGGGARLLAPAAVLALLAGWLVSSRLPVPGTATALPGWAVAMCDVGQGDATLLRSGADRAVLVDAGPDPAAVDGCLDRLGVQHLDLVVLSHAHADHVLGLPGALEGRGVGRVLVSPLHAPAENDRRVRRWAAQAGAEVHVGGAGAAGGTDAGGFGVRWSVLAPPVGRYPPAGIAISPGSGEGREPGGDPEGTQVNESSLVVVAEVTTPEGTVRVATLGDLETQGQSALLSTMSDTPIAPVDVVKVSHHGSAKQVPALYERLGARVALVGVGAGNDYGHPAPSTLTMLRRTGATVLRTDRDGDVLLAPAPGGALTVSTRPP